jgi:hypothetical protein
VFPYRLSFFLSFFLFSWGGGCLFFLAGFDDNFSGLGWVFGREVCGWNVGLN